MHPKLASFSSALIFLLMPTVQGQPAASLFSYTLQVASFPDAAYAAIYAEALSHAGEAVGFGSVELAGRGHWTRVYVGSFKTAAEARQHGDALIIRKVINEYLVKPSSDLQAVRPRTVSRKPPIADSLAPQAATARDATVTAADRFMTRAAPLAVSQPAGRSWSRASNPADQLSLVIAAPAHAINDRDSRLPHPEPEMNQHIAVLLAPLKVFPMTLPVAEDMQLHLAPAIDAEAIPLPDPVYLAFNLISGNHSGHGGLWVSGDRQEALARLRYVIGNQPGLIDIDDSGAVYINRLRLSKAAGADRVAAANAALCIAEYIIANEGLMLLVQLTQGSQRYMLHIGRRAPSLGGVVDVSGGINLDNNYDSRINPYRRDGRKLNNERPPRGFDSMVAINPAARWFNLRTNEFVPPGQITFHELAEAHAKVVLNLDYLEHDSRPGAHDIALEREGRLKVQRPSANVVLTLGTNRLFRSEVEVRNFYAQTGSSASHPR